VIARMMEDGIVARYLADHCPQERLKLCRYLYKLPHTADQYLWGNSPFNELGRFGGLGDEMRKIVLESLVEYPGQQIEAAVVAPAKQLVAIASGEGYSPPSGTLTASSSITCLPWCRRCAQRVSGMAR
jgi:hypothetical protein